MRRMAWSDSLSKSKKIAYVVLSVGALAFLLYFFTNNHEVIVTPKSESTQNNGASPSVSINNQEVPYTAEFAIYTNGTFRIFTNSMYHELSPDVYIMSQEPNTLHVEKPNITWGDFFGTLPFEVTSECLTTGTGETFCTNDAQTLSFYINGTLNSDALNQVIGPNDRLIINYGDSLPESVEVEISN